MAERDFQTPSIHFNYNTLLVGELRLWTTGTKERWERYDVEALRDYLELVLAEMPEPKPIA